MLVHGEKLLSDFLVDLILKSCIIEIGRSYSSAGEHLLDVQGVVGSIPTNSTIFLKMKDSDVFFCLLSPIYVVYEKIGYDK